MPEHLALQTFTQCKLYDNDLDLMLMFHTPNPSWTIWDNGMMDSIMAWALQLVGPSVAVGRFQGNVGREFGRCRGRNTADSFSFTSFYFYVLDNFIPVQSTYSHFVFWCMPSVRRCFSLLFTAAFLLFTLLPFQFSECEGHGGFLEATLKCCHSFRGFMVLEVMNLLRGLAEYCGYIADTAW